MITYSYYYFLILIINPVQSQYIYQSSYILSSSGTRYYPANRPAQLISSIFVNSWKLCASQCNENTFCRIFDYGSIQTDQCLLFEGDIDVLGSIIPSIMPNAQVGIVQIEPFLFADYGQPCSIVCAESRYLRCNENSTCDCMPHTYWNTSSRMCLGQMTMSGAFCYPDMHMCRVDLNLFYSFNSQCIDTTTSSWPNGTIVADRNTVIEGSSSVGLDYPMGIDIYEDNNDESLVAVDSTKVQVHQVQVLQKLSAPYGVFLDENKATLYVADKDNHRIQSFNINDTIPLNGITVAGGNGPGSGSQQLNQPTDVWISKNTGVIYIADSNNHRVQRWNLGASSGVTIAGDPAGNAGSDLNRMSSPFAIAINNNETRMYITEIGNKRIEYFISPKKHTQLPYLLHS